MHASVMSWDALMQTLTRLGSQNLRGMWSFSEDSYSLIKLLLTNSITRRIHLLRKRWLQKERTFFNLVSLTRSRMTLTITLDEVPAFCIISNARLHLPALFWYSMMVWSFHYLFCNDCFIILTSTFRFFFQCLNQCFLGLNFSLRTLDLMSQSISASGSLGARFWPAVLESYDHWWLLGV